MAQLEDIQPGAFLDGVVSHTVIEVINVDWHGTDVLELIYRDNHGRVDNILVVRDQESDLTIIEEGQPWTFEADGALLRLVSEAQRIRWAHLFDPYVAVSSSLIEPLPHQITAVYSEMLPRQPLRYMLADDPGSGKTIMTGLYIKELIIRGDLERCLIVVPGNLVEQWQDELYQRFNLQFEIFTRDMNQSAHPDNVFHRHDLLIARMDQLARGDDLREKLKDTDWDLVAVDEAHKLSATYFGNEVKYTKRYRLGEELSELTRHFLLLTATPHNGKEREFQEFMSLLDADRFEGMYRPEVHTTDVSDLMRRMVKEDLTRFDGTPLFPERRAYTVTYTLSDDEARLYEGVTKYVRNEFNRAEQHLDGGRRGSVGFALTVLQRRLASSPAAIHESLKGRRERLKQRLQEAKIEHRVAQSGLPDLDAERIQDIGDAPAEEREAFERELVDEATAARTVEELQLEIDTLRDLETLARHVRQKGDDRKWEELSRLLQDQQEMFDSEGHRRKLVIFTENTATLRYLANRIRTLIGREEAVVTIHGGMRRSIRQDVQSAFTQDKAVQVLVATDAAGEGINLQRAHLMINYDLPWNPNRIEQRFGRIHRIGQTEVCHLWNLVADETREGDVYQTLLRKLDQERETLDGAVFDVLGKAIEGTELRRLMIEAVRYGNQPEVKSRLNQKLDDALNHDRLESLLRDEALANDVMSAEHLAAIREDIQRAQARRLQPHYIASFFQAAFEELGGTLHRREPGRYEITHVPSKIRSRGRRLSTDRNVLRQYERICFEKENARSEGKPTAELIAPGHPLLDSVIDLVLERHRSLLKQGAVLVDETDPGESPRALVYLEHTIEDARTTDDGTPRVASRRFQFAEVNVDEDDSTFGNAGPAPYLDYRIPTNREKELLEDTIASARNRIDIEEAAVSFAIQRIVPDHREHVRSVREPRAQKAMAAVKDRLTKEIQYWDHRAEELRLEEEAGHTHAKLNASKARKRADRLEERLQQRLNELDQQRRLTTRTPSVVGGALIVPAGLINRLDDERRTTPARFARATDRVERVAMDAVMDIERRRGGKPRDVGDQKLGYDVEVSPPDAGDLRFIEVKGRIAGADTVTITRNEILTALNRPEQWTLALVEVPRTEDLNEDDSFVVGESNVPYGADAPVKVRYVSQPQFNEPGFAATSINYNWNKLWKKGCVPDTKSEATPER